MTYEAVAAVSPVAGAAVSPPDAPTVPVNITTCPLVMADDALTR